VAKIKAINSQYCEKFGTFKAASGGCIADAPTKYKEELHSPPTRRFQTFAKAQLLAVWRMVRRRWWAPLLVKATWGW
jgi:hypothetical protein